jgi:hypothetical protein
VDPAYFHPNGSAEKPAQLVFTGSMDWYPNEHAIIHFMDAILPQLRRRVPGLTVAVVGRNPSDRLKAAGAAEGLQIAGTVDASMPPALVRFQFTNNLTGFGRYGVKFPNSEQEFARWVHDGLVAINAMVRLGQDVDSRSTMDSPSSDGGHGRYVILRSAAEAGLSPNGRLDVTSPARNRGTDGRDIGVDFAALERSTKDDWFRVETVSSTAAGYR